MIPPGVFPQSLAIVVHLISLGIPYAYKQLSDFIFYSQEYVIYIGHSRPLSCTKSGIRKEIIWPICFYIGCFISLNVFLPHLSTVIIMFNVCKLCVVCWKYCSHLWEEEIREFLETVWSLVCEDSKTLAPYCYSRKLSCRRCCYVVKGYFKLNTFRFTAKQSG